VIGELSSAPGRDGKMIFENIKLLAASTQPSEGEKAEKELRSVGHRSVELGFSFRLPQKSYSVGHGLKDVCFSRPNERR
jgi:hypothetical protein